MFCQALYQATRALMVIGILLGLYLCGHPWHEVYEVHGRQAQKMRMAVFGGVIFLISGKRGPVPLRPY